MKSIKLKIIIAGMMSKIGFLQAQIPQLSSLPGANAVIFLDFDGHTVDNTAWNYSGPIFCAPSGMNAANITNVFNRVAEDYRPFNINITTDSTYYHAAPVNRRMRVILTTTYEWFGNAGGVAFVGSFTWGDNTPCFVFTSLLGVNNPKNVAEAASHEAGHTLGLYHQAHYDNNCNLLSEYHYGVGSGEIGWAPIMGVGYSRNLTLWNNGPNPYGCTNYQNDLSIITSGNGITFRSDDHGNSFSGSTVLTFSGNSFSSQGIITQNTDADMFRITLSANGRFILNATPYNVGAGNSGSNLDMEVSLYNSAQNLLRIYNPANTLGAVIDTNLNAGTYYLKIEGKGNQFAPNYASLGSYTLNGTFSQTLPLRRLELSGAILNHRHRLTWLIDADENVTEQIVEISTNGRDFTPLFQASTTERSFVHDPGPNKIIYYRLKVSFDNGKTHYSNIVTLKNSSHEVYPWLTENMNSSKLTVSSPGRFSYVITDFSGKTITKGNVTAGLHHIDVGYLASGMYVIRFFDEAGFRSEKFMKK
ncbi:MAG: zinc-dependent metalloprotease [Chitinophagaceae bacterium]|nr:zinc-dependent metalloprotease [Chitinophagaceae bacterium]